MFKTIGLTIKQMTGLIVISVLIVGLGAGIYLVQREQTIKSRAAAENFVTAFEIKDANGNPVSCDSSTNPPTCTTPTLDINVRVGTTVPLLP